MTGFATRAEPTGAAGTRPRDSRRARDRADRRARPWTVGLLTALAVAAGLLWRNRAFFQVPLYEVGDAAANSLLVNEAKALDLLVGHYSRVGFNHPGPAVLQVQAAGEVLFTDLLGVTPAAHNGQVVAVVLLHATTLGAVAAVVQRWSGRWPVTAAGIATVLVWYSAHDFSLAGPWIPVLVIAPFLLLLVAAASVASGTGPHLPLLGLVGGLLVHAHVAFVLFVTALALASVSAWAVSDRLSPAGLVRAAPRAWAVGVAVVAAFLAPILLNTLLNWPGEVPKYLAYSSGEGDTAAERTVGAAFLFTRRSWTATEANPTDAVPLLVAASVVVLAVAAATLAPRHLRRPLLLLTAVTLLAEALFVVYALVGVDDLSAAYVGLFGRSLPAALLLVVVVSLTARLDAVQVPRTPGVGAVSLAAVVGIAGVLVGAVATTSETLRVRPEFTPDLPRVVAPVLAAADGRPLLLDLLHEAAPFAEGMALLLHAERTDVEACVLDPQFTVQVTPARICTPEQRATGQVVRLRPKGSQEAVTTREGFSDITVVP